ncbi:MAG TPA: LysR family transcriptional regulator [Thermohalobaculum sp.]|nr:LysR family transcriptional regulator [Thermohalobaculum sp.]
MTNIRHLPAAAATLDIDVLRTLVAIAETGSVTAAAARVARSPGAVSMQIKKLEETLGRSLFERSRQGMALSADGELLLSFARRMVELHREALDAFRAPELSGEVRIGTIDDFGVVRLSEVMAAFARSHPRVTVNIDMGPSAALGPKLDSGDLDLAVLTPGCAIPWRPTDQVLHEEQLVWVGRDGGHAVRCRPLPVALSATGCAWRNAAVEALERVGMRYRVAYTSEFYEGQKAALQADLAIAPLPRSLISQGLVQIRPAEGLPGIGTCRIALRLGPNPTDVTLALAERVAESYGAAWPAQGAA